MEVRSAAAEFRAMTKYGSDGVQLVAIGFSPPEGLAPIAEHLGWDGPFLADPALALYGRLGIGRGTVREVFNRATLSKYRQLMKQGASVHRPVDDPLQLGADALFVDGRVEWVIRPPSPDARPSVADLLAKLA